VFSVGTSSLFNYIAEPVLLARMAGALTVEINPADTLVSDAVEERLRVGASEALDALRVAMGVEEPGVEELGVEELGVEELSVEDQSNSPS
jgi:NAD-dependent deacetylase